MSEPVINFVVSKKPCWFWLHDYHYYTTKEVENRDMDIYVCVKCGRRSYRIPRKDSQLALKGADNG